MKEVSSHTRVSLPFESGIKGVSLFSSPKELKMKTFHLSVFGIFYPWPAVEATNVLLNKSQLNLQKVVTLEGRGKCYYGGMGANRHFGESKEIKLQTTAGRFQYLTMRLALFRYSSCSKL